MVNCNSHRISVALPSRQHVFSLSPESQVTLTCFYQGNRWKWCCTSSKTSWAGLACCCSYPLRNGHHVRKPRLSGACRGAQLSRLDLTRNEATSDHPATTKPAQTGRTTYNPQENMIHCKFLSFKSLNLGAIFYAAKADTQGKQR